MSVDITNIEIGEGVLGITYGVDDDGSGGTAIADVGATLGAELSYKKNHKDIEIGQVLAAVKSPVIGEEGTFKVKMLESSINNLAIALGGSPSLVTTDATSERYVFGNNKTTVYHKLTYTTPQIDDSSKDDIIIVYRARVDDISPVGFSKTEERAFEVTFKMFPETSNWSLFEFTHDK